MSRWSPFNIVGGAYKDDSLPWSAQDTVNYIPMSAKRAGTRSPSRLVGAPGLIPFADTGSNAPIRGMHNAEGTLFVVAGTTLYRINADATVDSLGTVPGTSRVKMAHNLITGGNQIAIANAQSGYVYNTYTGTFAQITDDGFPGAISFAFLDGYMLGIDPSRRFAFTSEPLDATKYSTLDRYQAEGSPDPLMGQLVTHREWWLMGARTIEPYVDTGAATGTFVRVSGVVIEHGLASSYAAAVLDNTAIWLGNDGVVYMANGYQPVPVSTMAITEAISGLDWSKAFAFTYEDRGLKIFYLTFPDGQTWGYDAVSHEWHRRQSYGFDRWRINDLVLWNGAWYAGDYTNGLIYRLEWGVQSENGTVMERRRTSGVVSDAENGVIVSGLKLVMDTGRSETSSLPFVASGHLPDKRSGLPQVYQYLITGQVPSTSVRLYSGMFPDGLTFDDKGYVSGTRTTAGDYTWTLAVTDATGREVLVADSDTTEAVYAWSFDLSDALSDDIGRVAMPFPDTVNSLLLAHSSTKVYTSPDGITWTATLGDPSDPPFASQVVATDTAWFLVCRNTGTFAQSLQRSTDQGATWSEVKHSGSSISTYYVIADGNVVMALSSGLALVSMDDGNTWSVPSTPTGWNPGDSSYKPTFLYVEAWDQWIIPGQGKIYTGDGHAPTAFVDTGLSTGRVGSCAYSPDLDMVVVGSETNVYTKTGKTGSWQTVSTSKNTAHSMCWHPALQLFISANGTYLYISADGATWTQETIYLVGGGAATVLAGSQGCVYIPWTGQIVLTYSNTTDHNMLVSNI